jgi:peroxiredoxin
VKEMGDLDKLQADFKEDGLVVVALSQDQEGPEIVKPFFKQHALKNLKMYFDPLGEAFGAFDLSGLPASVLIDHNGKEAIRMSGFLDWNNRGARMVVQDLVQRAKTAKEKQE